MNREIDYNEFENWREELDNDAHFIQQWVDDDAAQYEEMLAMFKDGIQVIIEGERDAD
jgi:hypothetical protein